MLSHTTPLSLLRPTHRFLLQKKPASRNPWNQDHWWNMNLLDDLCDRYADPNHPLTAEAAELRLRLGTVDLSEAQDCYRLVSEQSELPQLREPLGYLEHPLVLFGGAFVAQTMEDLRGGNARPPSSSRIHYAPLDDDSHQDEF